MKFKRQCQTVVNLIYDRLPNLKDKILDMPFGFNFGKKKEETNREKPDGVYHAEYLGGHKRYPAKQDVYVYIYHDRIIITGLNFTIPYSQMNDIKNLDGGKKLDADRLFALGVFGLLWKKGRTLTVLDYNDGIDVHPLILDFRDNMKYVQPVLYERMVRSRPLQTAINSEFTIKSDKSALLLSVEVTTPIITPGSQQKIVVNVLDEKSNQKVIGAKVNGEIAYPSGSRVLLEEDTSDNNGQTSYSWEINNDSELGKYGVILRATASGYKLSTITTTFEVRK